MAADEPVILTDFSTIHTQVIEIPNESRLDNISYGEQDGVWLYFGQPTPNSENTSHGSQSIASVERLDREGVWINEVSATAMPRASANGRDGRDWIELYNGGDSEVNLAGWHLGKDLDDPFLCELSGSIAPKSYKVFYADNSKKAAGDSLPMNVSMAGDLLVLSNASREIVIKQRAKMRLTSGRVQGDYSGDNIYKCYAYGCQFTAVGTYSAAPVFRIRVVFTLTVLPLK